MSLLLVQILFITILFKSKNISTGCGVTHGFAAKLFIQFLSIHLQSYSYQVGIGLAYDDLIACDNI